MALTDSGRQLLTYVAGAMADLTRAAELFSGGQQDPVLEIACSSSFARLWLCRHIGAFQKANPGIAIRMVSALWPDEYARVKADIQIRYGPAELVGEGAEPLLEDMVVPVCHPDLLRGGSLAESATLIHLLGSDNTWERWCRQQGRALGPAPALYVDAEELAVELAEQGQGVALCGQLLCRHLIEAGRLARAFAGEMPSSENYHLALGGAEKPKAAARHFKAWILETVRQAPSAGLGA